MSRGFIFDSGRCVGCGACTAACSLRNGWDFKPRNVYWWNSVLQPGLPVFSVSLACNHCEDPACLEGCPAGAYSKIGDAVVVDSEKCVGCRYCIWNCPFDAPVYESDKGVVGKCHSCYSSLAAGDLPACASGCPTGALSYADLKDIEENKPKWFPETRMKPLVKFRETITAEVEVYPSLKFPGEKQETQEIDKFYKKPEWSLVAFTILSLVSVSLVSSSLFTGNIPEAISVPIIIAAGISAFFHLGKPARSWRSVLNMSSPLSREIIIFLAFSASTLVAFLTSWQPAVLISAITGLALLAAIDMVYMLPDRKAVYHSGQVFPAGLMLIALLTGELLPFSFIAAIRIFLSVRLMLLKKEDIHQRLRFVRVAFLFIAWGGWMTGLAEPGLMSFLLIFAGELADRFLFYLDFTPVTFREFFLKNYSEALNEKERSKQRPHSDIP